MGLEEELQKLEDRIRQYGFCVAIEVTNRLGGEISHKEHQSFIAREFLRGLTGQQIPVKTALITAGTKYIPRKIGNADYKLKLMHYDRGLALDTLNEMMNDPYIQNNGNLIPMIMSWTPNVEFDSVSKLFYPNTEIFECAKRKHTETSRYSFDEYKRMVSKVKGVFMERYTANLLGMLLPDSIIVSNIRYGKKEIDIVVVAQEDEVKRALNDVRYFDSLKIGGNRI